MKTFFYETILGSENICNLVDDQKELLEGIKRGDRIVFYGRRNTGKTSLVKSKVIPKFSENGKGPVAVFVDLMGVKSIESIGRRIKFAVEQSFAKIGRLEKIVMDIGKILKNARPSISLDSITGNPTLSLGLESSSEEINLHDIFSLISAYHKKRTLLLVFDEFQDISYVPEAEGIMRDVLQNLPGDLPVLILGSKKHLLANIFANPDAPFAGWGRFLEISSIENRDYHKYIEERFIPFNLKISPEVVQTIQDLLDNIPEAINIVCDQVLRDLSCKKLVEVKEVDVKNALRKTIENRSGLFEERFIRFSDKERRFLEMLAVYGPVLRPNGKEFLKKVNLSSGGSGPLIKKLRTDAVIYKTKKGYVISDPLMAHYLRVKN